jgi:hypothetical protein
LCTSAWTSLYYARNIFLSIHIPLYFMFSTVVYSLKGSIFLHVLVKNEDMLIRDLSFRLSVLIFFNNSSGITISKPIHKVHIGVFFREIHHVYICSHCTPTTGQTGSPCAIARNANVIMTRTHPCLNVSPT